MNSLSHHPFVRSLVVVVPGLLIALYLASALGHGDIPLVVYFLIGVAVLLGVKIFTKRIRLEAQILGILLFGYIVGQSGFGHFSFSPRRGIYLGEIGLMICMAALFMRRAFTREKLVPSDSLAWAVCAFVAIGTVRFLYDVSHSIEPMVVVRDFATIYYALFYFIAFSICRHLSSKLFLQRTFTVALICAIFVSGVFFTVPSIFNYLIVHGRPFIEPRADLTGSFMGFACICFFLNSQLKGHSIRWSILSFASFVALLLPLSRATFLGFAAAVVILMLSGQAKFLLRVLVFLAIGIMILIPIVLTMKSTGEATYATQLRDKVLSTVDPFGNKRTFASDVGEASAGNNEFRARWWQSVINETNDRSPLVGLGFGYDLAKRFLQGYTAVNQYEFDARSPHSIILTVYGRMGIVGIIAFGVVIFLILRSSLRCAAAVRRRKTSPLDIAQWCGVLAILVTACFGVMLEGPMAAIVFWSLLGMASYREWERTQPAQKKVAPVAESPSEVLQPISSRVTSRLA
jgi:O-antigen ligase